MQIKSLTVTLFVVIALFFSMGTALAAKTTKEELDAAKKAKKTVFLVVSGNGSQAANCMKIAQQAQKQLKESLVLSMNRDDEANKALVATLGLGSAPLPMLMVIGMNGVAAGGMAEKDATAEKLVQLAPSPKKAEALGYINDKKPVFIIGYKKSFSDRSKVTENCKTAITSLKGNAAYVEIDLDDANEKAFLKQIGTDFSATTTQILVFNAQGKNTGNYKGATEPAKLVSTATMVPKSGCAPGACGPGTKGCAK